MNSKWNCCINNWLKRKRKNADELSIGSLIQPVWTWNHNREYRYYTRSKRIKTGYAKCKLPSLPAGEIESTVVDQLRSVFQNPEVIARTFREVATLAKDGPSADELARLDELRTRRKQVGQAIRSLLTLDDPESEFLQTELKDLHGQLKSLDESIRQIETRPATDADLEAVTYALQRLDPIWEVLYPEEQRRVLELLVERIDVGSTTVDVQFRADGIEQIVAELESGEYSRIDELASAKKLDVSRRQEWR